MPPVDQPSLAREFTALLGSDRLRPARDQETRCAGLVIEPADADEVGAVVRKCERDKLTLAPVGTARTLAQMRRAPVDVLVSLARLRRVVAYEPADMTLVVEAGATLDEINTLMATHNQRLPADPPQPDLTTIGALIAGAKAGPLRLSEGTIRDLLIGVRLVGHDGRAIHAGGRVVKNVAGYDLMKVMTGSYGTLGIITEAAFKVRPIPPDYHLASACCTALIAAFSAATKIIDTTPVVHCDVVSPGFAARFGEAAGFAVLAGFAGPRTAIDHQAALIQNALGAAPRLFADADAVAAYRELRDLTLEQAALIAQIAVPPAALSPLLADLATDGIAFRAHAGSGVAQLYLPTKYEADRAAEWFSRAAERATTARGHLRLVAGRSDLRDRLPMFPTPSAPALALMRRLKTAFDPHGVFNPGCFVGGI